MVSCGLDANNNELCELISESDLLNTITHFKFMIIENDFYLKLII